MRKKLLLGVQKACDGVGIQTAAEGENVQLIQLGDFLQEILAVRPQARVQHGLPPAQLEVEDAFVGHLGTVLLSRMNQGLVQVNHENQFSVSM